MSKIEHVVVQEITYEADDVGFDQGGFDFVYVPGNRQKMTRYALTIETTDGCRGEYVGVWGATPMAMAQTVMLASRLPGRDAWQRELINDEFKRALRQYDHMGHGMIDIVLWDWAGKRLGTSVSNLLGGFRKRLPTYASTPHGDRHGGLSTKEHYVDFARQCYDLGYRAFKVHGWWDGNVEEEVGVILALGEAVGDRMKLMLDPACHIRNLADCLRIGQACDEAGFMWLEDPMRDTGVSFHAHKIMRERIKTPILMTEHVRGLEPKADCAVAGATDFLRADPEYDMGITGTMKIAHVAEALGIDVEIHACGPAHRAVMSAIRNTNFYEVFLCAPKCANPLPPVYTCGYEDSLHGVGADGCFPVPEGVGLGVTYDWDYINAHTTAKFEFRP